MGHYNTCLDHLETCLKVGSFYYPTVAQNTALKNYNLTTVVVIILFLKKIIKANIKRYKKYTLRNTTLMKLIIYR